MAGARLFGSEFDRANGSRLRVLHRRNTGGRRFFLTGVRLFGRHPRRSGLVLTRYCSFAREETLESLGEALELAHGTNTFESNPKRGWRAKSSAFRLYRSSLGNLESRLFSRTLPLKKNRPAVEGILVYAWPVRGLLGRNRLTGRFFSREGISCLSSAGRTPRSPYGASPPGAS